MWAIQTFGNPTVHTAYAPPIFATITSEMPDQFTCHTH